MNVSPDNSGPGSSAAVPCAGPLAAVPWQSDIELAEALRRRDRKAAAEFVSRYSGLLHSYLRSRVAPAVDQVEDLMQEVIVAAWQQLAAYRGQSPLQAWLMGIARHKVSDYYRGRLRQPEGWDEPPLEVAAENMQTPEQWAEGRQSAERTMAILGELPEHYRLILLWRYWEQCSARQIAEATGQSEKGVERMLARAREQFKRRWLDE